MLSPKRKIKLAVIFGGRSGEHEVSLCSAASVISALDTRQYQVLPVLIDKHGGWNLETGFPGTSGTSQPVVLRPDPRKPALLDPKTGRQVVGIDVVLPLIHGTYGEDGCLQGVLEMAGLPYAGCGVLGSAVGMDKALQKQLWQEAGLPIVPWFSFTDLDWPLNKKGIQSQAAKIGYPVFVKPANLGSSVGISRVAGPRQLTRAINEALRYDTKVVIEKGIEPLREIEFAVMGTTASPEVSLPGEVVASNAFYDYAAKYVDGESELHVPAMLPVKLTDRLAKLAAAAWQSVDAYGFARIDFLLQASTGKVYLNEINTVPGFTEISMFPQLWQASGLSYSELLDRLIVLAFARHERRSRLSREFAIPTKKPSKRRAR
jgi:D-alanine-D-alanine ligase